MLQVIMMVGAFWAVLMLGALALARGIVVAASAADRNTRRQLLVRHATGPRSAGYRPPRR